jgi:hypothetical protein
VFLLSLILIKIASGGFPSYDFLINFLLKQFFIASLKICGKIAFIFLLFGSPLVTSPLRKERKERERGREGGREGERERKRERERERF